MVSAEFTQAATDSRKLTEKPSDGDLLQLYALYKQATQDPAFESVTKPGMFDLKAKAKYNEWEKIVKEGVTPEQAETKYIELVTKFKTEYKYDANKTAD